MKSVRVVAALLAHPDDAPGSGRRYLVQRRPPGKARAGQWEFPGGKVEPGESDEAALVRECQEELHVQVTPQGLVAETSHAYVDLQVTLALHRAALTAGTPRAADGQALAWCTPREMVALPFVEADVPLVAALARGEG